MARCLWMAGVTTLSVAAFSGCLNFRNEPPTPQVTGDPFDAPPPGGAPLDKGGTGGVTRASFAPASADVALRVDQIGRKILAANPEVGAKPLFATIGAPQAEIFHQEGKVVYVTEGLVRQCRSDAELSAVLCHQLGRMVAERESKVAAEIRQPERLAPIDVPTGNGVNFGGQDMTRMAELGKFEKQQPRNRPAPQRPDPNKLAAIYLEKAGYQKAELDMVQPLLQSAEKNVNLERQFKGTVVPAKWTP